jgi:hypothetical protein
MTRLTLKRASASLSSSEWSEDDYDVLDDAVVVGRIFTSLVAPKDPPSRPEQWCNLLISAGLRNRPAGMGAFSALCAGPSILVPS